jgi:hypothetical protein
VPESRKWDLTLFVNGHQINQSKYPGNKKMRTLFSALIMVASLVGSPAIAQESLLDVVMDACEDDLNKYCTQVTPGDGRLLHCVAAHQDKISGQCEYALYEAALILQQLTEAIYYVATECDGDIEEHCSDVAIGEGRILACLEQDDVELSESCATALSDTVGE